MRASLLICSLVVAFNLVNVVAARSSEPARMIVPRVDYTARDGQIETLRVELIESNPQRFEARVHRRPSGESLLYRWFAPPVPAPGEKLPLVVVLHGSSGRGNDNLAQIAGNNTCIGAGVWTLPKNQAAHPCFVLAPQCPPNETWTERPDWSAPSRLHTERPTTAMAMVMELLDEVLKSEAVDPHRVYLSGSSMGGFGAWDLGARMPQHFAALMPICGTIAQGQARRIATIPTWIFHGGADPLIPVSVSRHAFDELQSFGGKPRYTEYENGGHSIGVYAWTEPELMTWLFAQRRSR